MPFPLPLLPEVIVIHEILLLAVHAQPDGDVTFSVPVLAIAATVWLVDKREEVQVTVTVTLAVLPLPAALTPFTV